MTLTGAALPSAAEIVHSQCVPNVDGKSPKKYSSRVAMEDAGAISPILRVAKASDGTGPRRRRRQATEARRHTRGPERADFPFGDPTGPSSRPAGRLGLAAADRPKRQPAARGRRLRSRQARAPAA